MNKVLYHSYYFKKIDCNTFKNIDTMFDKCYKEFNINKVCNVCEIYKIPNNTIFSNKINKYI